MRHMVAIILIAVLFNSALAAQLTGPVLSSFAATAAVGPIIAPLDKSRTLQKAQVKIREQALTDGQLVKLSQEVLQFLQTPAAFDREIRLDKLSLRQHILKSHVAFNGMIPRYGDFDYANSKTVFVSQTATGGDVIKMLQEKISSTKIEHCHLSYLIVDGKLYLNIHMPVLTNNLFYYSHGKKIKFDYIRIGVKKVWLHDHWSNNLGASTIFPTNQLLTSSQTINLTAPTKELIAEYQALENSYQEHPVVTFKQPTEPRLLVLRDQAVDLDADDINKIEAEVEQEFVENTTNNDNQNAPEIQVKSELKGNNMVYTYSNGDQYQGEWFKSKPKSIGKPQGAGKMTYADGSVYEGNWLKGKPHGRGKIVYADGSTFDGSWNEGLKDGWGTMQHQSEQGKIGVYVGSFEAGIMQGQGTFTYANGDVYTGRWVRNHPKEGAMTYANGDRYLGKFIAGEKSSAGVMTYANQDEYQGEWRDGKKHGLGVMKFNNGVTYKGEFTDDEMTGSGTVYYANGSQETGQWLNGKLVNQSAREQGGTAGGSSVFVYPNGDIYQGQWQDGQPHGAGVKKLAKCSYDSTWERGEMQYTANTKFTNENGQVYQGQWLNGKPHGIGKLIKPNGEIYDETRWINGRLVELIRFTDLQHNQYYGSWDINKNGQGVCIFSNQDKYDGAWKEGEFHGQGRYTQASGAVQLGMFKHGILVEAADNVQERVADESDVQYDLNLLARLSAEYSYDMAVSGNLVFMAQSLGGLRVLDISDLNHIKVVDTLYKAGDDDQSRQRYRCQGFDQDYCIDRVAVTNNLAFVMCGNGKLKVFDFTDPQHIHEITGATVQEDSWKFKNFVNNGVIEMKIYGNSLFITDKQGLKIIDITNAAKMRKVASFTMDNVSGGLAFSGDLVFVGYDKGFKIINCHDLNNLCEVGRCCDYGDNRVDGIAIKGNLAFVGIHKHGLKIFDFSNVKQINQVGQFGQEQYIKNIRSIVIKDDLVFVMSYASWEGGGVSLIQRYMGGLTVLDCKNLDNIKVVQEVHFNPACPMTVAATANARRSWVLASDMDTLHIYSASVK